MTARYFFANERENSGNKRPFVFGGSFIEVMNCNKNVFGKCLLNNRVEIKVTDKKIIKKLFLRFPKNY